MIIDAHIHLPVKNKNSTFEKSKKELLKNMKQNNITYVILIPDNIIGSTIGDLDVCLKLIENEKQLFMLGTIDNTTQGKEWIEKLNSLFTENKIKGIKIFPGHDPIYPTDKRLIPIYNLCIKHNSPLVIHTGINPNNPDVAKYNDPKHIIEIAKTFPKLNIVIAHFFWPKIEYCYNLTKDYNNIYFDTSALADNEVIEKTGLDNITKVLTHTIKDNPERVLFGTDYAMCDTKSHINLIKSLNISEEEKEMIFFENTNKLFRLKIE